MTSNPGTTRAGAALELIIAVAVMVGESSDRHAGQMVRRLSGTGSEAGYSQE
jgi:hypothetical protein